jgi:hypothetical protein
MVQPRSHRVLTSNVFCTLPRGEGIIEGRTPRAPDREGGTRHLREPSDTSETHHNTLGSSESRRHDVKVAEHCEASRRTLVTNGSCVRVTSTLTCSHRILERARQLDARLDQRTSSENPR